MCCMSGFWVFILVHSALASAVPLALASDFRTVKDMLQFVVRKGSWDENDVRFGHSAEYWQHLLVNR